VAKLPSVDLREALFTIMVFFMALVLIKGLTSQQKQCSNVPMLIEFTGLPLL
jgi:hypothetical protein